MIEKLYKEKGRQRQALDDSLDLVSKLMRNICEHPNEEKFRSFKKVREKTQNTGKLEDQGEVD